MSEDDYRSLPLPSSIHRFISSDVCIHICFTANGLSPPGPKLVAVVAVGTGGDVSHHRRLVTRTVGDDVADHHRRLVIRAGGDMVITAGSCYQPVVMSLYSIKPQPLLPPTSLLLQPDGHTSLFHCCGRILPKFSRNLAILDVLTLPTCSKVSSHQLIGFVPIFFYYSYIS